MPVSYINSAALLVCSVLLAVGQLLFKQVGLTIRGQLPARVLNLLVSNTTFYLALALYGVATLFWIWLLSRVPLTQAYPWAALAIAIVPLLSIMVFGETVRPLYWLGIILIAAGVIVTQYGLEV